jgi:hypothetical protein
MKKDKDLVVGKVMTSLKDTFKVENIAPGRCTGEPTFAALKQAFGDRYIYSGVGTTLALGPSMARGVLSTVGIGSVSSRSAVKIQRRAQRSQRGLKFSKSGAGVRQKIPMLLSGSKPYKQNANVGSKIHGM